MRLSGYAEMRLCGDAVYGIYRFVAFPLSQDSNRFVAFPHSQDSSNITLELPGIKTKRL
jgi:hypothetical protein